MNLLYIRNENSIIRTKICFFFCDLEIVANKAKIGYIDKKPDIRYLPIVNEQICHMSLSDIGILIVGRGDKLNISPMLILNVSLVSDLQSTVNNFVV